MRSAAVVIGLCAYARTATAEISAEAAHQAVQAAGSHLDITTGVGVAGFIDRNMRNAVGAGVSWALRGALGNPRSVGVELAYVGSLQPILLMDAGSNVVAHGVHGGFRINVVPELSWEPFFFLGAGWSRYSVSQRPMGSVLSAHDDVAEFPIGLGGAYRRRGFVADLRIGVRVITAPDLLTNPDAEGSEDSYMLHRYGATAHVGYSF
jgi:hypothetical protein